MQLSNSREKRAKLFGKDFVARLRIVLIVWLCVGFAGGIRLYEAESSASHALLSLWFLFVYMLILFGIDGGASLLGFIRQRSMNVAEINRQAYSVRKFLLTAGLDFVVLFVLASIYTYTGNTSSASIPSWVLIANFITAFGMYIVSRIAELQAYKHPETLRQH